MGTLGHSNPEGFVISLRDIWTQIRS